MCPPDSPRITPPFPYTPYILSKQETRSHCYASRLSLRPYHKNDDYTHTVMIMLMVLLYTERHPHVHLVTLHHRGCLFFAVRDWKQTHYVYRPEDSLRGGGSSSYGDNLFVHIAHHMKSVYGYIRVGLAYTIMGRANIDCDVACWPCSVFMTSVWSGAKGPSQFWRKVSRLKVVR